MIHKKQDICISGRSLVCVSMASEIGGYVLEKIPLWAKELCHALVPSIAVSLTVRRLACAIPPQQYSPTAGN